MSASLIGRLGSSAFRPSAAPVSMSPTARASLRNRHQGPSIMGFEDGVEQSLGRPCRLVDSRSKRTYELTSSIVPRGTSFHRSVELEFPPIAFDAARLSCGCGFLPDPAELSTVNPDAVHDHGQTARASATVAFFIPRCLAIFLAHALSQDHFVERTSMMWASFVEHRPHHLVAAPRYRTASVDLTRDAPRPTVASARGQRTLACGKGSVFSLEGLLRDQLVQRRFRDGLLQALVLPLEVLHPVILHDHLNDIHFHPVEPLAFRLTLAKAF